MSSIHAAPQNYTRLDTKRQKLRKGTHSCWECKRRKMKCIFDSTSHTTTCKGCYRRGSKCISQQFPEEQSCPTEKIADGSICGGRAHGNAGNGIPTPASVISEPSPHLSFYTSAENEILHPVTDGVTRTARGKNAKLSSFLYRSLPSKEDTEKICTAYRHPSILAHEAMTAPYTAGALDNHNPATPETLMNIPGPDTHPVLIARHMLLLATFIQHLHPDVLRDIDGLSEPPKVIMERLAQVAVNLVTTNDDLLGSIEGVECVMIETLYQVNTGNLRRGWISGRRAMSIAQLMGLHKTQSPARYKVLDPETKFHPEHTWFRIVFMDRYLCLLLGVSQGTPDQSMASDLLLANDTPTGRLERIHCVIASRILERNESFSSSSGIEMTRILDVEIQDAARSLPSKWWLAPNLEMDSMESQAMFWNTRRPFTQMFHYNLLNQLHLPYMLRSMSAEHKYEYSRVTCVNASREVLSRFISLRSFDGLACTCRTLDFLALMAAMTLLLAHIDSSLSDGENFLAHQYPSDRAMIEKVQESMGEANSLNSDALSAQSADLLGRLLALETKPVDPGRARRVSVQESGSTTDFLDQQGDTIVSVHIPYFGTIKITRDGLRREARNPQDTLSVPEYSAANSSAHSISKPFLQHDEYPELAAGSEDWALQGADLAFFESLMRSDWNGMDGSRQGQ